MYRIHQYRHNCVLPKIMVRSREVGLHTGAQINGQLLMTTYQSNFHSKLHSINGPYKATLLISGPYKLHSISSW